QVTSRAGFGFLHNGSIDSLSRFVSEPGFQLVSLQEVSDLIAFLLSFSGSDLPAQAGHPLEPAGPTSQDTHAAVGKQTTLVDASNPAPGQRDLISSMLSLADQEVVGVVGKGLSGGWERCVGD